MNWYRLTPNSIAYGIVGRNPLAVVIQAADHYYTCRIDNGSGIEDGDFITAATIERAKSECEKLVEYYLNERKWMWRYLILFGLMFLVIISILIWWLL